MQLGQKKEALGLGKSGQKSWFSRHLVNPNPVLKAIDML
jgi:hypothetical protein